MENQTEKQTITSTPENATPKKEKSYEEAFAELRGFILKSRTEEVEKDK